jgi:hypothetical protein
MQMWAHFGQWNRDEHFADNPVGSFLNLGTREARYLSSYL